MTTFQLIGHISSGTILFPATAAFFKRKLLPGHIRFFAWLMFLTVFVEIYANVTVSVFNKNNMIMMHFYVLLEFTLLSLYYSSFMQRRWQKQFINAMIPLFNGFLIVYIFFMNNPYEFNGLVRTLQCIICTVYSLTAFYQIMQTSDHERLEKRPDFWLNLGVLLYFAGNTFVFVFRYIPGMANYHNMFWHFHTVLNISGNLLFMIGFLCLRKTQTS